MYVNCPLMNGKVKGGGGLEYWRCYVYIGIVMLLCFDTRVITNIDTTQQTNYSGIENSAIFETNIERGYLF